MLIMNLEVFQPRPKPSRKDQMQFFSFLPEWETCALWRSQQR
ncbi:hypothetical protein HanXRQr2_Chr16g0736521 [Helianthus annuus]|uniref:Uncharacterized protein n=1 Tax=Helianthus annuus TaxID=4232 RepID=A0A9K3DQM1_HELAN|nr:hypothetical protein HanXRQr2_Chr16g0736521 [Helianthus annuus]